MKGVLHNDFHKKWSKTAELEDDRDRNSAKAVLQKKER